MVVNMHNFAVKETIEPTPVWLDNFVTIYQKLSVDNLQLIDVIYDQDVVFIDPMHKVEGLNALNQYFGDLYTNLTECSFVIEHIVQQEYEASLYWTMTYKHPKLNNGIEVSVEGHSHIKARGDKVIFHRDYLDLGAMLYEQVPVLGSLVKWVKTKAAK